MNLLKVAVIMLVFCHLHSMDINNLTVLSCPNIDRQIEWKNYIVKHKEIIGQLKPVVKETKVWSNEKVKEYKHDNLVEGLSKNNLIIISVNNDAALIEINLDTNEIWEGEKRVKVNKEVLKKLHKDLAVLGENTKNDGGLLLPKQ